jgi:glycerophosphoryl diester phosphodiesterase
VPRGEPLFHGRPTVIGHRGAGARVVAGLRENSVSSLLAAVRSGLHWVELDVHRCSDGLALLHDPAHRPGELVISRSVEELRACEVDDLAAALDALPAWVGVDIDVKSSLEDAVAGGDESTAAVLAPLVERELSRRPVLVTSFDPAVLLELRARVPEARLGLLTWYRFPLRLAVAAAGRLGMDVLALEVSSLGAPDASGRFAVRPDAAQALDVAHDAGMEVAVWCPDPAVAAVLADLGVDAVVVDHVVVDDGVVEGVADDLLPPDRAVAVRGRVTQAGA